MELELSQRQLQELREKRRKYNIAAHEAYEDWCSEMSYCDDLMCRRGDWNVSSTEDWKQEALKAKQKEQELYFKALDIQIEYELIHDQINKIEDELEKEGN